MSRSRTTIVATVALSMMMAFAASVPGRAQDDLRKKGDKFCRHDARTICKEVLGQGDMVVLACFQENKARLSSGCRKFLTEIGQLP